MLTALLVAAAAQTPTPPNVVLIVADDIGVDRIGAYAEHPDPGRTPNIDRLARLGVLYRHAYANPTCSPTRATIMTGRYGFRTGVTSIITLNGGQAELDPSELILSEVLPPTYTNCFVGKWHLGNNPQHPNLSGLVEFVGTNSNLYPGSYYNWEKNTNGLMSTVTNYATSEVVNEAIAFVSSATEPYVLELFTHAAHIPTHIPPLNLTTYDTELATANLNVDADRPLFMRSWVEALDTELGRLLQVCLASPNTYVIFTTDNGTSELATDAPFDPWHAKGTMYEGGVNVPLIVIGPGIPAGTECLSLINLSDLFATVLELTGVQSVAEDSRSFVPTLFDPSIDDHRDWVYAERCCQRMILGRTGGSAWKLIEDTQTGEQELYNLDLDPWETTDETHNGPMSLAERRAWAWLKGHWPS